MSISYKNEGIPPFVNFKDIPEVLLVEVNGIFKLLADPFKDCAFTEFIEAYNYAIGNGFQVIFNCNDLADTLKKEKDKILFYDTDKIIFKDESNEDNIVRMVCYGNSKESTVERVRQAYKDFIALTLDYDSNPHNWIICHKWLSYHPAFWHRTETRTGLSNWIINDGLHSASLFVSWEESPEDENVFIVHGESVKPEATVFTVNEDLSIAGKSYEECVIRLAEAVRKHYLLDGNKA